MAAEARLRIGGGLGVLPHRFIDLAQPCWLGQKSIQAIVVLFAHQV
jgi:hypothetical protein